MWIVDGASVLEYEDVFLSEFKKKTSLCESNFLWKQSYKFDTDFYPSLFIMARKQ